MARLSFIHEVPEFEALLPIVAEERRISVALTRWPCRTPRSRSRRRAWYPSSESPDESRDGAHDRKRQQHHAHRLIFDGLIQAGEKIPPSLRERILGLGEAAGPTLVSILCDERLMPEDGPGEGWAPISAATLLGELRVPLAIEPLLDVLVESDALDILGDRALSALRKMGAPAVEPVLARHATAETDLVRHFLASALVGLGARDERILSLLVAQLDEDPEGGAMGLAEYGHPDALPHLARALDALEVPESDSMLADQAFIELRTAIEDLGGTLTPEQQERLNRAGWARREWRAKLDAALPGHAPYGAPKKIGRNEPCPCGSGKKYKKCFMHKDEAAGRAGGGGLIGEDP